MTAAATLEAVKLPPRDQPHTTAQAAAALAIPERLIWDWKHRGLIEPAGMLRGRGRGGYVPLYRLDELDELATRWKDRR